MHHGTPAWVAPGARLMFAVGLPGACPTFSSYSYEPMRPLRDGQIAMAAVNVIGSVILGLIAAFAGIVIGSSV